MDLSPQYDATQSQDKWYSYWQEKGYFRSTPDAREPYTIVIPPPNVTGVLHMGHMLNNTIQDVLIRKARLEGKNACWVPGTDHASIATEAKVVKLLREQGIKKSDIGRDAFLEHAFAWKDKYGGIILEQLQKLGASCDWDRTRFTMEEGLSKAVIHVFVDLHKKGHIYRGLRMTNWDPEALTVLSNEEVIYKEEQSRLYHVRYQIEGTDEWLTIATTRPETILADAGIAVHPEDARYVHLKGKHVLVPMVGRRIPIIFDDYVDQEFGTGALKVTPAHDMNDYEIGQKHGLEVIDMLHENGRLNDKAQFYVGMDRFEARKQIAKDLKAQGFLVKAENYTNNVGRSERTDAVVEPRLTLQWFMKMDGFAATALKAVEDEEINFRPPHFINMYRNWLAEDKIKDWCISRQLWWGHRIPAYYYKDEAFVAETAEEALAQAKAKTGNDALTIEDLKQDEDVVDTWFSAWLWPISVFDGFENQEELKYYYPTNVLVTGWDIIFFWVARMVMAGYEWSEELLGEAHIAEHGKQPFKDVYFTGMVRDKQRRKMSKSLGNSPDAIALIDKYGADGVRFGMLSCAAAGNDIIFDAPFDKKTKKALNESKLCEQGRNFCNKMWNVLRLIKGWEVQDEPTSQEQAQINALAADWLNQRYQQTLQKMEKSFAEFRLSEALMDLYNFIWGDFCSWYLEIIKPPYGEAIDRATLERTISFFEEFMTILHPFMPFVTEEIWSQLRPRKEGEDCMVSTWPTPKDFDANFLAQIEQMKDIISKVRDIRNQNQLGQKENLDLFAKKENSLEALFQIEGLQACIRKMAYIDALEFTEADDIQGESFISGAAQFVLAFEKEVDVAAELNQIREDLAYQKGFLQKVNKKLSNARFVDNAPEAVVARERQKQSDAESRIAILEKELARLEAL